MRHSRRFIGFRSPALAFAIALSPALFQTVYSCERGDTYLLSLQFEVGGQNLVQGFNVNKRSGYGVITSSSTATLTVVTRFADSTANYQWLVGGASTDAQPIGVGGGTVTLDVPRGQSELLVSVRAGAPNTAVGFYTVNVNRVDTDSCVGNSMGDPHLITFDRLHYDLQTVGEYVLTRSTLGGFEIQARTSPWGTSRLASVNIAFAADVGGDIVSLYLGDPDVFINHQRVSLSEREKVDLPQGGSVERFRAVTEIVWPTGEIAQITRHGSYLNLQVVVPIARCPDLVGLLGSGDSDPANDLWPRDAASPLGPPVSFADLLYVFGDSWRIMQAESLFEDVGDTDPSFPDSRVTSADLPQAVRDAAETFCLDQGVLDPILLEDCVLDYGLTQDPSFVEVYRYLFPPVMQATVTVEIVVGTFDTSRGGALNFAESSSLTQIRNEILTALPEVTFVTTDALTTAFLNTVDVLMISSVKGNTIAIVPLSASEQAALRAFIENGGGALLFPDNNTFNGPASEPANESLIDTFGLDITGSLGGSQGVTVINASSSPITNGPFGLVTSFTHYYSGYFDNLGPNAQSLATMNANLQPGLALIPRDTLTAGSGAVLLFSDATLVVNGSVTPANVVLLKNALHHVARLAE